ncbi:MAG: DNA polymerase III subunit delta [Rhizomicrobium sp.]|jgi:DNA polymerase-3 subunit delta
MIVKTSDGDRFAARPPADLVAALLYGPDQGLVRERADRLAATVCADLRDPFRVSELDEAGISSDHARLADEAAALSMTGGRRVVRVRSAGNALAGIFESLLDTSGGGALVVVEAGDLPKGSSLREVFEDAKNAAAIACYPDSADGLAQLLHNALKADGVRISDDALDVAVSLLGADRAMTRQQIEKLALYARGFDRLEIRDVRAVMGDEAEARIEEVCDAAGEGDWAKLDRALERLWSENTSPIAVVRVAMAHFQRLALVRTGQDVETVLKRRPAIHFSRAVSFRAQAKRWSEARLQETLDLLLETEALCKTTAVPAEAACARAFFTVAAWAKLRS